MHWNVIVMLFLGEHWKCNDFFSIDSIREHLFVDALMILHKFYFYLTRFLFLLLFNKSGFRIHCFKCFLFCSRNDFDVWVNFSRISNRFLINWFAWSYSRCDCLNLAWNLAFWVKIWLNNNFLYKTLLTLLKLCLIDHHPPSPKFPPSSTPNPQIPIQN